MIYEAHCLFVDGSDFKKLRSVLEDRYWNDHENIICVPVKELTDEEIREIFESSMDVNNVRKAQYIITQID